jgi:hypothetical protein
MAQDKDFSLQKLLEFGGKLAREVLYPTETKWLTTKRSSHEFQSKFRLESAKFCPGLLDSFWIDHTHAELGTCFPDHGKTR